MDDFWIVQTVSELAEQFLDCPDSFWIVRTVFGLCGQFLDGYGDNYEDDKDEDQLGGLVTGFVQRRWCAMPNSEEQENN